jgi:hypothetical protein
MIGGSVKAARDYSGTLLATNVDDSASSAIFYSSPRQAGSWTSLRRFKFSRVLTVVPELGWTFLVDNDFVFTIMGNNGATMNELYLPETAAQKIYGIGDTQELISAAVCFWVTDKVCFSS